MQDHRYDGSLQRGGTLNGQINRAWGLCLNPVAKSAQGAIGSERCADAGNQRVELYISITALHHDLDFGLVLVVIAHRLQSHLWLSRIAIAQDQQAWCWHPLRQDLAAQSSRSQGLQESVQGGEDGFASCGHGVIC